MMPTLSQQAASQGIRSILLIWAFKGLFGLLLLSIWLPVKGNLKPSAPQCMHPVKAMVYLVDAESAMRGIAPICI